MCGIGRAVPDDEAPGHTSEAAAASRLIRIADVRSGTDEQEDGATHKGTSSAREKPTKVNVDDEGRSGVREQKWPHIRCGQRKPPRRRAHVPHVLCYETNRIWRTRRWPVESSLRKVNSQTGGTRRHLSAVAMNALTSGHNSEQVTKWSPQDSIPTGAVCYATMALQDSDESTSSSGESWAIFNLQS